MSIQTTPEELAAAVDEFAIIKARISDLKQRESIYKAFLIATEQTAINGTLHSVNITSSSRSATDWEAIARACIDPELLPDLVKEYTTTGAPFFTVKVTARKAEQ